MNEHFYSLKSLLFVPGNRPERYQKARDSGASAYCIDLEDAVSAHDKAMARDAALAHFSGTDAGGFLRINRLATRFGVQDLLSLCACDSSALPAVVVIPMVTSPFEIRQLLQVLAAVPAPGIIPMIESPEGLDNLPAILHEGRGHIAAVAFGSADYAASLGSDMSWDALRSVRSELVKVASRFAVPCIDGPCFDTQDLQGIAAEATRVASLGFSGKLAIHPQQVAVINDAFKPSPEKLDWARKVVAAFEKAGGGVVSLNGMMVDQPVVDQALGIIASDIK